MRVILLDGNQNSAVACVRSLGQAGYSVFVGEASRYSKAGCSRHAAGTFSYPAPLQDVDAFLRRIAEEVRREPGTLVVPVTDATTMLISAHRDLVSAAGGRLVLPPHNTVMRAFDKFEMTQLAESLGISVPQTTLITNPMEARQLAPSLRYPVVMKPRTSVEFSSAGQNRRTGTPAYARNPHEFLTAYRELSRCCASLLVQDFIDGTGVGYFALMREGELRAEFAHRRIRDVRPSGSGSAVRISVQPARELRTAALAMLRALSWHGVAMVEFRQRPDGAPFLMEVNGRFWNSLPLAVYAGVDFPVLLARMAEGGDIEGPSTYRQDVRCRWLVGDFCHLLQVWRGAPNGYAGEFPGRLQSLFRFLLPVPGTFHDNFTVRDPMPEVADWIDFVFRWAPEAVGEMLKKRKQKLQASRESSREESNMFSNTC